MAGCGLHPPPPTGANKYRLKAIIWNYKHISPVGLRVVEVPVAVDVAKASESTYDS